MAARRRVVSNTGADWKSVPGMPAFVWSVIETGEWEFDGKKSAIHPVWNLHAFWTPAVIRMGMEPGPVIRIPSGGLILIPPHTWFRVITSYRGTPGHHAWCHFTTEEGVVLEERAKASPVGFIRYRDRAGMIAGRMQTMAQLATTDRLGNYWSVQKIIAEILEQLQMAVPMGAGWYEITGATRQGAADAIVASALRYMSLHLAERVTMPSMARALNVSVSTLAHRFSAGAHEAPMQALRRLRLLRAKTLLSEGLTLDVVAERSGYYDRQHLTREFRKAEGCTPGVFRRGKQR